MIFLLIALSSPFNIFAESNNSNCILEVLSILNSKGKKEIRHISSDNEKMTLVIADTKQIFDGSGMTTDLGSGDSGFTNAYNYESYLTGMINKVYYSYGPGAPGTLSSGKGHDKLENMLEACTLSSFNEVRKNASLLLEEMKTNK